MIKTTIDDMYDMDSNDFGFSAVSEDELKAMERQLQKEVTSKEQALAEIEETYKGKLEQLYKMVMPLLVNLAKDDSKEYIYWPNRSQKMNDFISKVKKIVNS